MYLPNMIKADFVLNMIGVLFVVIDSCTFMGMAVL